ncbi:MAG: IPT/TIG domain-containing protein, partial [marine benthic group bacterium]|nr:IPT/TIG domain-containing protein [Gemmatimonadota bacterium]
MRNVGLSITALAVLALGGCDSNPLDFNVKDTVGIQVNPSEMVVAAGRTADLESRAVNQGNEPTFDAVSAAVDPVCGPGSITVVPDPEALEIQPPGLFVVTGGSVLGQTCIVLTSGSNTAQVDVTVVADAIEITAPEDGVELEAGDTGTVVAQLIGLDGAVAGPYAPEDAVFVSDDTDVLSFTDDMGAFTTGTSGSATVSVTWSGQAANGTSGLGVVLTDEILVNVLAGDPVTAAFANPILGAFEVGAVDDFEVFVYDALGNINTNASEITGVTVTSSDALIATATAALVPGATAELVNVIVTVTAVGGGTATISGVVQTTNGDLPFTADYPVVAPSITALSAAAGGYAETITITGTGLSVPGLSTLVFVDGEQLGNFTVDSDTQITAQMPTYTVAGTHNVVVSVAGVETIEDITWNQTNACYANDLTWTPGPPLYGPVVDVSIPLRCNGTATDADNSNAWFVAPISADALGGGDDISVNYAPTWGAPLKDIDWLYCGDAGVDPGNPFGACVFEIDQPPATVDLDLGVGDHVFLEDDYASYTNGDFTLQDYT